MNKPGTNLPDENVNKLVKSFIERAQFGFKKYGVTTERTDLSLCEWMQHLQEELQDSLVYLQRMKIDVEKIVELILSFGWIDGANHKQWVLDQILRIIFQDKYDDLITEYNDDGKWDIGIAPILHFSINNNKKRCNK